MVTVRFNSQHPRKIIRGVGERRSRKGPGGATHCPVTPVGIMALSLIKVQVAALAWLTRTQHVQRGHLEGTFGENRFPKWDQPNHPSLRFTIGGELPQHKVP